MAAASSVVDLRALAEAKLDAATSAKFFRDGGDGAGGATSSCSWSWPEAEKTTSELMTQSALQALCEKYEVPAGYTPIIPDGRWVVCQTPPEGCICVYADALEAGMRILLHEFYVAVLEHYGLAPSQLAPDAWRYLADFVLLSQDAGVEPSLPVFLSFFTLCTHGGDSVGWYHFVTSGLVTGKMLARSAGWKSRFFLLRAPATMPWPCAVKWGKPSRAAVLSPPPEGEEACDTVVKKKLLDRAAESLGIDLMSFLCGCSLPVALTLQQRAGKVEAAAAAAAAEPTPRGKRSRSLEIATRDPDVPAACASPPGFSLVAVGQRQSCSSALGNDDGSAMEGFVHSMRGMFQLVEKAMAELKEKEKELQASEAEVTELRHTLMATNMEHAAEVAKLNQDHAAEVARLKQVAEGEVQDARKDMVLALLPKLDNSLLGSLQQEIMRRLQTDQ